MAAKASIVIMPIVSKMYCSPSQVILVVRRRPHVVHGGGLVVTDCAQKVVFRVDGCGIIGKDGELLLRDGDGESLLLIRRKEGIVEALNINKHWKGCAFDYDGSEKKVFTIREPNSFLTKNNPIKISTQARGCGTNWDFQVKGSFQDRTCSIVDSVGNIIAEIGIRKDVGEMMTGSKDLYHVIVKPGIDQAFVFGVLAVLDYIHDSRC